MFTKNKCGQSILEYALLIAIVISGLLIMQSFVKRGLQGGLKESADKMGEQFSASGTTTHQQRTMANDRKITEEVATTTGGTGISNFVGDELKGTVDKGVYSYSSSTGGTTTAETKTKTDSAKQEKFGWDEHPDTVQPDYTLGE